MRASCMNGRSSRPRRRWSDILARRRSECSMACSSLSLAPKWMTVGAPTPCSAWLPTPEVVLASAISTSSSFALLSALVRGAALEVLARRAALEVLALTAPPAPLPLPAPRPLPPAPRLAAPAAVLAVAEVPGSAAPPLRAPLPPRANMQLGASPSRKKIITSSASAC